MEECALSNHVGLGIDDIIYAGYTERGLSNSGARWNAEQGKDALCLIALGVCSIPCQSGEMNTDKPEYQVTSDSLTREKKAVADHSIDLSHHILLNYTKLLAKKIQEQGPA